MPALIAALLLVRVALSARTSVERGQTWPLLLLASGVLVGVGGAAWFRWKAAKAGHEARSGIAYVLDDLAEVPALDEAVQRFRLITGEPAPIASVSSSFAPETIDAELVYLTEHADDDGFHHVVPLSDAQTAAVAAIAFSERMLSEYGSAELTAVLLHLFERGRILRGVSQPTTNGVREADSRALLASHEHAALLRAIENATRPRYTLPPGMGHVRFADADLIAAETSTTGAPTRWEQADRVSELREHLGALGLDVPSTRG